MVQVWFSLAPTIALATTTTIAAAAAALAVAATIALATTTTIASYFLMRYSMLFFRSGFLFSPQAGPRAAKSRSGVKTCCFYDASTTLYLQF